SRWAKYEVERSALSESRGPYKATVKLIAQMLPVNLVAEIQGVGFDYFMSSRQVADRIVQGAQVLWEREFEIR
ncbi:MAG: hypothetical protein O6942_04795, partial [Bacteroidetes bacterium]|nr:hypothetical protein [Bacteroidota bacterium]